MSRRLPFCHDMRWNLSRMGTHLLYNIQQNIITIMNQKILDPMEVAKRLTAMVLNLADLVYPDSRRAMEKEFKLRNGIFNRA